MTGGGIATIGRIRFMCETCREERIGDFQGYLTSGEGGRYQGKCPVCRRQTTIPFTDALRRLAEFGMYDEGFNGPCLVRPFVPYTGEARELNPEEAQRVDAGVAAEAARTARRKRRWGRFYRAPKPTPPPGASGPDLGDRLFGDTHIFYPDDQ